MAVFLVVIPVICAERVKWFDFVPAWFVGAGIFFATFNYYLMKGSDYITVNDGDVCISCSLYAHVAAAVLLSCLWGLIYGWVTVFLRVKYTEAVTTEESAE